MVSVNVVVLAGRLVTEPEEREMPNGDKVVKLRLSVPVAGETVLPLPISVWDKDARRATAGLQVGDALLVRGCLRRHFLRDGGGGRSVMEVVASEVKKLEAETGE